MWSTSLVTAAAIAGISAVGTTTVALHSQTPSAAPAVVAAGPSPSEVTRLLDRDARQGASRSRTLATKTESLRLRAEQSHLAAARAAEQARAARSAGLVRAAQLRAAATRAQASVDASSFSDTERRIRSCESGPNGSASDGRAHDANYSAQNPSSTASGAWQFLDTTWNGYDGYSRASSAPAGVQDAKARSYMDANGYSAWDASRACWSA